MFVRWMVIALCTALSSSFWVIIMALYAHYATRNPPAKGDWIGTTVFVTGLTVVGFHRIVAIGRRVNTESNATRIET